MTGGGLLGLIAYGAQNVILSGNPQMTFFYKAFRRYSHFSQESITTIMDGPNELFYDQPIKVRAKIQRSGDLLSDMYFSFRVPDIFSKFLPTSYNRPTQIQYQWVRYLGAAIIQNAAFFIGGQKIQEFDGNYLLAKALADYDTDKFDKWRELVGDIPELTDPGNGAYAGGTNRTGYPTVFKDNTSPNGGQVNRPSIFGQDIHVPLSFWFSDFNSLALPLVGLQYHECEVQITLNPIRTLYTLLDVSGYRVAPDYKMLQSLALIRNNQPDYVTSGDISGQWRFFATDVGSTVPSLNGWFLNPRIQSTYIYLTEEERHVFASTPLSYMFSQVTNYPFPGLFNRQILDLETHNPITRLLFVPRRSDSLLYRNDFGNLTNWWNFPNPPFNPTPNLSAINTSAYSSGRLIPQGQMDILRAIRVICDGNEIQEEKPIDYFTKITPWKSLNGKPLKLVPVYNFALGSPSTQPNGSVNASRIRNFQVEVDVHPLPVNTNYVYDLNIYVENINFLVIEGGMGGLKYAL
jgi:hypothetical protein